LLIKGFVVVIRILVNVSVCWLRGCPSSRVVRRDPVIILIQRGRRPTVPDDRAIFFDLEDLEEIRELNVDAARRQVFLADHALFVELALDNLAV